MQEAFPCQCTALSQALPWMKGAMRPLRFSTIFRTPNLLLPLKFSAVFGNLGLLGGGLAFCCPGMEEIGRYQGFSAVLSFFLCPAAVDLSILLHWAFGMALLYLHSRATTREGGTTVDCSKVRGEDAAYFKVFQGFLLRR